MRKIFRVGDMVVCGALQQDYAYIAYHDNYAALLCDGRGFPCGWTFIHNLNIIAGQALAWNQDISLAFKTSSCTTLTSTKDSIYRILLTEGAESSPLLNEVDYIINRLNF